jgi:rod shape-determining protein MreD
MTWLRYPITFILLYLLAVLQNGFFAHYSFFGAVPNLVFALFFTLVFFSGKNDYCYIAFISISAGLFLDAFSTAQFGISTVLLLLIGFMARKIQGILQVKNGNNFPFIYFLPIFFVLIMVYDLALKMFSFDLGFLAGIVYNLVFVSLFFYICKKFFLSKENNCNLVCLMNEKL